MSRSTKKTKSTIIIGIDFGTTYSGIAYTVSSTGGRVKSITNWEVGQYSTSNKDKVPSTLHYLLGSGSETGLRWGYEVMNHEPAARWIKLLLLDDEDKKEARDFVEVANAEQYLGKVGKTAEEVIAAYLLELWNYSMDQLVEAVGCELLDVSCFRVVFTVPAIWPQYAVGRMRTAIEMAGIDKGPNNRETDISFITEPEAAALATFAEMGDRADIQEKDSFVIVDCGGGTVDLISYEVKRRNPIQIDECVAGAGKLCGAVFLDIAFTRLLQRKLGPKRCCQLPQEDLHKMLQENWESGIKRNWRGQKTTWIIDVPFACWTNEDHSNASGGARIAPRISITSGEVGRVFNPIVDQISSLIQDQINAVKQKTEKKPKYVIMVGGFGRCPYLCDKVDAALRRQKIKTLRCRDADIWTAVSRGAVIQAATQADFRIKDKVKVTSRKARAHYGFFTTEDFDKDLHPADDKEWCEDEANYVTRNVLSWFVKKGDTIDDKYKVDFEYYWFWKGHTDKISLPILTSDASVPPAHHDDSVKDLCTIEWRPNIDISRLSKVSDSRGKVHILVVFRIEVAVYGSTVDFTIYHDGKRQASKSAKTASSPKEAQPPAEEESMFTN